MLCMGVRTFDHQDQGNTTMCVERATDEAFAWGRGHLGAVVRPEGRLLGLLALVDNVDIITIRHAGSGSRAIGIRLAQQFHRKCRLISTGNGDVSTGTSSKACVQSCKYAHVLHSLSAIIVSTCTVYKGDAVSVAL